MISVAAWVVIEPNFQTCSLGERTPKDRGRLPFREVRLTAVAGAVIVCPPWGARGGVAVAKATCEE